MLKDKYQNANGKTAYDLLPIHRKTGVNISLVRKDRHITQKQLAEVLSLSKDTMSKIEAGKRRLDYTEILQLARFLNVPVSVISPVPPEK